MQGFPLKFFHSLKQKFGDWNAKSTYEHIAYEYLNQDPEFVDIATPDKRNATMYAVLNLPVYEEHEDYPAFRMGIEVFGGGFLSSRLANRIRQKDGLSYGVRARIITLPPDPTSLFQSYVIFAPENRDLVSSAFSEELNKLLDEGVTEEELKATVEGYLDRSRNLRNNDANVASQLQANLRWGRTMAFIENMENAIAELTPDQVRNALVKHLNPDKVAIFRAGDFENNPALTALNVSE